MNNRHYLFSFVAVAFTLAAIGTATSSALVPLNDKLNQVKARQNKIELPKAPEVAPQKTELPPVIELDDIPAAPRRSTPKVGNTVAMKAKIAAPKEKEFVCESQWQDSTLFAGGRFKRCEWK